MVKYGKRRKFRRNLDLNFLPNSLPENQPVDLEGNCSERFDETVRGIQLVLPRRLKYSPIPEKSKQIVLI